MSVSKSLDSLQLDYALCSAFSDNGGQQQLISPDILTAENVMKDGPQVQVFAYSEDPSSLCLLVRHFEKLPVDKDMVINWAQSEFMGQLAEVGEITTTMLAIHTQKPSSQSADRTLFFPNQLSAAQKAADMFFDGNNGHWTSSDGTKFKDMDFVLLMPPRLTLQQQCLERAMDAFSPGKGSLFEFLPGTFKALDQGGRQLQLRKYLQSRVRLLCDFKGVKKDSEGVMQFQSLSAATVWQKVYQDIKDHPDRLFLILLDECHWGINKDGMVDSAFVQHQDMVSNNVFFVHISATAWNHHRAIEQYQSNVIRLISPSDYRGFQFYLQQSNILIGEDAPPLRSPIWNCRKHLFDRFSDASVAVIFDYVRALLNISGASQVTTSVRKMLSQSQDRSMIMIRLTDEVYVSAFAQLLKRYRQRSGFKYTVVVSVQEGDESEVNFLQFEELEKVQGFCFLLVLEKARMGDTLPQSLKLFDLRARYTKGKVQYSTFIQDAGRVFGYRRFPPKLALSQVGYNVFKGDQDCCRPDQYMKNGNVLDGVADLSLQDASTEDSSDPLYFFTGDFQATGSHMLHGMQPEVISHIKSNRFVLTAEPQSGKTGAIFAIIGAVASKLNISLAYEDAQNELTRWSSAEWVAEWHQQGQQWARDIQQFKNEVLQQPKLLLQYHESYKAARASWNDDCFNNFSSRISAIIGLKLHDSSSNYNIADLGCGPSSFVFDDILPDLVLHDQQINVLAVDVLDFQEFGSARKVLVDSSRKESVTYKRHDLAQLSNLFSNSERSQFLDLAIMRLSFWDVTYLQEVKRCLKDDGTLFILQSFGDACILNEKWNNPNKPSEIKKEWWNMYLEQYGFKIISIQTVPIAQSGGAVDFWIISAVLNRK
ncbi:hypothetical protein MP228_010594 [Amoeboaphelidium protococcarum]|nr:hypothetical protein MP228_010594 [Amoeboaphelidium protococcarum]